MCSPPLQCDTDQARADDRHSPFAHRLSAVGIDRRRGPASADGERRRLRPTVRAVGASRPAFDNSEGGRHDPTRAYSGTRLHRLPSACPHVRKPAACQLRAPCDGPELPASGGLSWQPSLLMLASGRVRTSTRVGVRWCDGWLQPAWRQDEGALGFVPCRLVIV
jgi:hypothetical protein